MSTSSMMAFAFITSENVGHVPLILRFSHHFDPHPSKAFSAANHTNQASKLR